MGERFSLCMIVRDEAEHLARCLASVQGAVDEIVVVDTGSRDDTVAVARSFGAIVAEVPWQNDFAAARNESLRLASGDWVLYLDADEELLPESRQHLPALAAHPNREGYFVQIHNLVGTQADHESEVTAGFRLFRNRPAYRFVGTVHEQILPVIRAVSPQAEIGHSPLKLVHYGYLREYAEAKGKADRNLKLLGARLALEPSDPFVRYSLGVEHFGQGRFEEARQAFQAALAGAPTDAPWRPKLVKCHAATLCELGQWKAALMVLGAERERYPAYTDLVYMQGVAYGRLGRQEEAARCFTACLRMGPAPSPPFAAVDPDMGGCKAYLGLGKACEALGRGAEAMQAYLRAAASRQGWVEPLQRLASHLARTVDDEQLARLLGALLPGRSPRDQEALASLFAHAGRYQLALDHLGSEPREPAGLYLRALCLAKLGRCDEALSICGAGLEGSAFERSARALRLYCQVLAGGDLQPDAEVQAIYADLAPLLAGEPPEQVERFLRRLPKSRQLARLLKRAD